MAKVQLNVQNKFFGLPLETIWELNYVKKEYSSLQGEKFITISNDGNYLAIIIIQNPTLFIFSLPMKTLSYQRSIKINKLQKIKSVFFSKCSQHLLLQLQNQVIWFDMENPNTIQKMIKFTLQMFHFTTNDNHILFMVTQNNQIYVYNLINAQQINIIDGNRWYYNMESNSVHIYPLQKDTLLINVNFSSNYIEGVTYLLNSSNGKTLEQGGHYNNIFKQPFYTHKLSYQAYEDKTNFCFKIFFFRTRKLLRKIIFKKCKESLQFLKQINYVMTNQDLVIIIKLIDRWAKKHTTVLGIHCINVKLQILTEYPNFQNIYFTTNNCYQIIDEQVLKIAQFKQD